MNNNRIILASQSQARKKAMVLLGLKYECIPAHINEKEIRDRDPIKMAQLISEAKALSIAQKENGIIIAGDAFLVFEGKVLEKPLSLQEAHGMLQSLSGNMHTFITSLSVYEAGTKRMRSVATHCNIYFREISNAEIEFYCSRYPVLTLAGAYETDGVALFSSKVEGSCNFFTALPMKELVEFLNDIDKDLLNGN